MWRRFALLALLALPLSADLGGTYTLDRGRSDDVNAAIDAVVKKMGVLTRPIARRRLRATNPAYARIGLAFTGDGARVTAGGATLTLPASGAPVRWRRDGETLSVSGRRDGASYVETFTAKDGRRTNTFTPEGDGLVLHVVVTSSRLPAPLRYSLHYHRS